MGGQETLLLVARHPRLLAGAAAFDPVVDFRLQYREFPELGCARSCQKTWNGPMGRALQALARPEIGGPPAAVPYAYELRSPLTYARRIAFSRVPLQIWWTPKDAIVIHQQRQAAKLVEAITRFNPAADLLAFTGGWRHSAEMRAKARLPLALSIFGLLPDRYGRLQGVRIVSAWPTPHFNERRSRKLRQSARPSRCQPSIFSASSRSSSAIGRGRGLTFSSSLEPAHHLSPPRLRVELHRPRALADAVSLRLDLGDGELDAGAGHLEAVGVADERLETRWEDAEHRVAGALVGQPRLDETGLLGGQQLHPRAEGVGERLRAEAHGEERRLVRDELA